MQKEGSRFYNFEKIEKIKVTNAHGRKIAVAKLMRKWSGPLA
jgi:hypothetical protein